MGRRCLGVGTLLGVAGLAFWPALVFAGGGGGGGGVQAVTVAAPAWPLWLAFAASLLMGAWPRRR